MNLLPDELSNPPPIVTGRMRRGEETIHSAPRNTWLFADVIEELLRVTGTLGRSAGTSRTDIELVGAFSGSAPSLELPPELVAQLAAANTQISIAVQPLETALLARVGEARRTGKIETELYVKFIVSGHFDPDAFGRRVGVVVSRILREEDPRPLKARVSFWRERLGPFSAAEFPSSATDQLLSHVAPQAERIRDAVNELGLKSALAFTALCADATPSLIVTADQLALVARLGAWLEYSISIPREHGDLLEF